jgi:hypothetical protein
MGAGVSWRQLLLPSTPPTSSHTAHAGLGHASTPCTPKVQPVLQLVHAETDVAPAKEYGVAAGHGTQPTVVEFGPPL